MTDKYWINNNKFIFRPNFNEDINDYLSLISKYDELIFSDYNKLSILLQNYNCFSCCHLKYLKCSKFNQIIINLPNNLKKIFIGYHFNKSINLDSNTNLTQLTFGSNFNQIVNLNSNTNLTQLTFGENFNQIVDLPNTIINLQLNCNNKYLIDNLPNSIEEIIIGSNFELELNNLPNSIKKIIFKNNHYDKELNSLPNSIEYLALPSYYNKQIKNFPKKLKIIECRSHYEFKNDLDNYQIIIH